MTLKFEVIKNFSLDRILDYPPEKAAQKGERSGHGSYHYNRRKFINIAGCTIVGTSMSGLFGYLRPEKAHAGCFVDYYGQTWCDPYSIWFYRYYQQQLQAQYGRLLLSQLQNLTLSAYRMPAFKPTTGYISLLNNKYTPSSGQLSLTVVDSRSLDELEGVTSNSYSIPPRTVQTIRFNDGPSAQSAGRKKFSAWTARGGRSKDFIVYA
jgi:hypothetical protein